MGALIEGVYCSCCYHTHHRLLHFQTVFIVQMYINANIYGDDPVLKKQYPEWSNYLAKIVSIIPMVPFPVCAIVKIVREPNGTIWQVST